MSYDNWKEVNFSELGRIVTGKTPKTKIDRFWNGTIPFITPKDIQVNKYVHSTERYITEDGLATVSSQLLPKKSICVSCIGNIGYVGFTNNESISNQQINSIIPNEEYDSDYVYYLMKNYWPIFKSLENQSTTVSILNKSHFSALKVRVTKNNVEQKAIANILSSLDDKIELNNKINKNLEEMAQALYKQWFVDFEFPNEDGEPYKSSGGEMKESELGLIPKGWKVSEIDKYSSLQIGGDWGKEEYFEGSVQVTCLRGTDIQKIKETGYSEGAPIRWIKASSLPKRKMNSLDILVGGSGLGPIGRSFYIHNNLHELYASDIIYSNFCKRIRCSNESTAIYIEHLLELMHTSGEINSYVSGTSIPNLDIKGLLKARVIFPPQELLDAFGKFKGDYLESKLSKENINLANIRDTLLPKLMSGEI